MSLRRSKPLKRGKALKSGKPPKKMSGPIRRFVELVRRTPLKPFNRKRRAELKELNYGIKGPWTREHPCYFCERIRQKQRGRTVAAHMPYTKAARPGIRWMIPACVGCENDFHKMGRKTFEKWHVLDLEEVATMFHQAFLKAHPEALADELD